MNEKEPIITIRNLRKSYDRKTEVLKGIDLDIHGGQIVGYIGPNGAGKTTTVKILTGMMPDFSGDVTVLGYDLKKDSMAVKARIGYVPENAALYDTLTPAEYLDFIGCLYDIPPAAVASRTNAMLTLMGLGDNIHQRMTTFSKGMRQKVLFVAGIIHDPEIIFLDEPLSGLDANTAITIKEILTQLAAAGKTIFYCSHIMDVVERVSDRIVILNNGGIVADGPFSQLQAKAADDGQSLEKIFTRLTGGHEHSQTARQFLEALETPS